VLEPKSQKKSPLRSLLGVKIWSNLNGCDEKENFVQAVTESKALLVSLLK
jgi:hypothetical protein